VTLQTSENSVMAKFTLPYRPGPEGLPWEGPSYIRQVLSFSYVLQSTMRLSCT
jgi:hypothetical protein